MKSQFFLRYPWKRNWNALPMSLFAHIVDYVWESNWTLKHHGIWPKKLQSPITFSYEVTKMFSRYPWKRNWIALLMSLFAPIGDFVWESNRTLKHSGVWPRKLQSPITFSYEVTQLFSRHLWKRNWNALPMSLFSPIVDYIWESNWTLKHSGIWPRKLRRIFFNYLSKLPKTTFTKIRLN